MNAPKISVIMPDISSNSLGASTVMGSILNRNFEVEIIGPDLGQGVNEMYRSSFDYKVVPLPKLYRLPEFWSGCRKLADAVTGDVVVAIKAFADTLPVALREKKRRGCRVVIYLDEWDGAVHCQKPLGERIRDRLKHAHHPLHECHSPKVERLIPQVDQVISTNTFLQQKFGGRMIHYGVDCDQFAPQPAEQSHGLKDMLGLVDYTLIVFGGVVRPHKGIEQILDALSRLKDSRLRFLVVGPLTDHLSALKRNPDYSSLIHCAGPKAKEEMPMYLDLADMIVIPLESTLLSKSQMPCKIYEAMAMSKPIVGSEVSDLPLALDGCGWTYPTGDVDKLAGAIKEIMNHPEAAAEKGQAARQKCINEFSLKVTEQAWLDVVNNLN